ncbi:hypothetical protein SKPI104516_10755 [Skermania piniformis]
MNRRRARPPESPKTERPAAAAAGRSYRPNRILSTDEIADVVERYEAGATVAELASSYRAHRETISRALAKSGVVTRYRKDKMNRHG